MLKFTLLICLLFSQLSYAFDIHQTTKDYVRIDLWLNGVELDQEAQALEETKVIEEISIALELE